MYQLIDALDFIKWEIERLEKRMEEEQNGYYKEELESLIEWNFERGISMIQYARLGEVDQNVIDFFLGRTEKRPDLAKTEELFEKAESRNWLERIWDEIRWWWFK